MLDLYFWPTPNGYKVSILLEELGLAYQVIPVHIGKGDQFKPEFLAISPNNKIPALVDHDGPGGKPYSLFESAAIMLYLCEKTGSDLLPSDARERHDTMQWLMFQASGVGPMLGQAHHFRKYAPEQIQYAIDRYTNEATRLYKVIDLRLKNARYLGGDTYSVADIATYPWLRPHKWQGQNLDDYPHLLRWYEEVRARPAVQRGLAVLGEKIDRSGAKPSGERWDNLFGKNQLEKSGKGD